MFASAEKISTKEVKQNMGTQNEVFDAEVMGEQLKKLRKKEKLSQEKFAERMGMSKDTIYNYEKGKTFSVYQIAYGTLYGYRNRAVWCKADTTS